MCWGKKVLLLILGEGVCWGEKEGVSVGLSGIKECVGDERVCFGGKGVLY